MKLLKLLLLSLDLRFINSTISHIDQLVVVSRRFWRRICEIIKGAPFNLLRSTIELFLEHALFMEDISLARLLEWIIFFMILQVKFIIIDSIATWFDSAQVFRVFILPINYLFAFLKLVILYASTKLVWFFITATIKQLFIVAATRWVLTFTVYFWEVGPIDHFLLLIELQPPWHPLISNTCGLHRLHIVITLWLI